MGVGVGSGGKTKRKGEKKTDEVGVGGSISGVTARITPNSSISESI